MSKAAVKRKKETLPEIPSAEVHPRKVQAVPLSSIDPSPFETQERRRARFDKAETAELAEDIRINGLTHPILLRPKKKRFEIVVGERRFLAVSLLGHKTIDATVEELTDAAAFEKQQSENKQRKAPHPVDEAFAYKLMGEEFGYDDAEIAARDGKTVSYVEGRKELLKLAPAVLAEFEAGRILLGHALEIAKLPGEWHERLLQLVSPQRGADGEGMVTVRAFIARIQNEFLHRLDVAPFPIGDARLRSDGLVCKECPHRTGARMRLFKDDYGSKDQCLDPQCWNNKADTFIQIQRLAVVEPERAADAPITGEDLEKAKAVPLVAEEYVYENVPNLLQKWQIKMLKKADECESAETGIYYNGPNVGKPAYFCRTKACKKHYGSTSPSSGKTESPEAAREARMRRKEELIDIRVGEVVRKLVFGMAAAKFAETFAISEKIAGDSILAETAAYCIEHLPHEHATHVLDPFMSGLKGSVGPAMSGARRCYSLDQLKEAFSSFELAQIIFVCLHADKGAMYWDSYVSQVAVVELAKAYDVDYPLIDAEQRLVHVMEKHKKWSEHFRQYLEAIKGGKRDTPIPRVFAEDYRPSK